MEWLWTIPLSALGIYATVILLTRLSGLRSFSTMSGFDFAMTVATGSLIATTILSGRPTLLQGMLGVATLFLLQYAVARLRRAGRFEEVVDNAPLLLVRRGQILEDHMRSARITRPDLLAKLRENGILRLQDVEAVILETTGKVSVIPVTPGVELDEALLDSVRT